MRKIVGFIIIAIVFGAYFWDWDSGEVKDPEAVIRNSVEDINDKVNEEVQEIGDTGEAIERRFDKRANDPNQVKGR